MTGGHESGESRSTMEPEEYREYFNHAFAEFSAELKRDAANLDPNFERLVGYTMDTMLNSGKRLRPYLCYLAYKGFGGTDDTDILPVSMASEVYHSALLVHDDVMDNDLLRHGTLNVIGRYAQDLQAQGESEEVAVELAKSMAILAGDLLAGLTFGSILGSGLPDDVKVRLTREIVSLNASECAGQQLDALLNTLPVEDASEDDIYKLYTFKTALYTYDLPLRFGAMVAGASQEDLNVLTTFATKVGIAFQITDDVIGIFGDEEQIGKPVGSDIREGKKTLLVVRAFALAQKEERELLKQILGNPFVTEEDITTVRALLDELGVRESVEETARGLVTEATQELEMSSISNDVKAQLITISEKLIGRTV